MIAASLAIPAAQATGASGDAEMLAYAAAVTAMREEHANWTPPVAPGSPNRSPSRRRSPSRPCRRHPSRSRDPEPPTEPEPPTDPAKNRTRRPPHKAGKVPPRGAPEQCPSSGRYFRFMTPRRGCYNCANNRPAASTVAAGRLYAGASDPPPRPCQHPPMGHDRQRRSRGPARVRSPDRPPQVAGPGTANLPVRRPVSPAASAPSP